MPLSGRSSELVETAADLHKISLDSACDGWYYAFNLIIIRVNVITL
jgi:hypothetical protein